MKKKTTARNRKGKAADLRTRYRFDYRKAKPNRFATSFKPGSRVVTLDPDIASAFTTPESVNNVLRALLETMPARPKSKS